MTQIMTNTMTNNYPQELLQCNGTFLKQWNLNKFDQDFSIFIFQIERSLQAFVLDKTQNRVQPLRQLPSELVQFLSSNPNLVQIQDFIETSCYPTVLSQDQDLHFGIKIRGLLGGGCACSKKVKKDTSEKPNETEKFKELLEKAREAKDKGNKEEATRFYTQAMAHASKDEQEQVQKEIKAMESSPERRRAYEADDDEPRRDEIQYGDAGADGANKGDYKEKLDSLSQALKSNDFISCKKAIFQLMEMNPQRIDNVNEYQNKLFEFLQNDNAFNSVKGHVENFKGSLAVVLKNLVLYRFSQAKSSDSQMSEAEIENSIKIIDEEIKKTIARESDGSLSDHIYDLEFTRCLLELMPNMERQSDRIKAIYNEQKIPALKGTDIFAANDTRVKATEKFRGVSSKVEGHINSNITNQTIETLLGLQLIRMDGEVAKDPADVIKSIQGIIATGFDKELLAKRPNWKVYYKLIKDLIFLAEKLLQDKADDTVIQQLIIGDKDNKKSSGVQFTLFNMLRQEKDYNWRIREVAFKGLHRLWDRIKDPKIKTQIQAAFIAKSVQTDARVLELLHSDQVKGTSIYESSNEEANREAANFIEQEVNALRDELLELDQGADNEETRQRKKYLESIFNKIQDNVRNDPNANVKDAEYLMEGNKELGSGNYGQAVQQFRKYAEQKKLKFGEDSIEYANALDFLVRGLEKNGFYDEAVVLATKSIKIKEALLDPEDLELATSYQNFGLVLKSKGKYDDSLTYHNKCLEIRKVKLITNHPEIATAYHNIGNTYDGDEKYRQALENHKIALSMRMEKLDPDHRDVAASYNSMANAYYCLGDRDEANVNYHKALQIRLKVLGPDHPDVAGSYNNIANVYLSQKKYEESLANHRKSLEIKLKKLDADHPNVAMTYANMGIVYKAQGKYDLSLENYKKALAIRIEKLGKDHHLTKAMQKQVDELKSKVK